MADLTEATLAGTTDKTEASVLERATQLRGIARQAWQEFHTNPPQDEAERPDIAARAEYVAFVESQLRPGTNITFSGAYETITHETHPTVRTVREYHPVTDQEATIVTAVVPGSSDDPEITISLADQPDSRAYISLYKVTDFQIVESQELAA